MSGFVHVVEARQWAHASDSSGKVEGYLGECWKCGKVGHKQDECRSSYVGECVDHDPDGQELDVGGVWSIGSAHIRESVDGDSQGEFVVVCRQPSPPRNSSARSVSCAPSPQS